jgi:hypothetical protein
VWVSATESAKLLPSDEQAGAEFGHAVALRGSMVAVGAFTMDVLDYDDGAVYVFEKPEGGWSGTLTETQRLTPAGAQERELFGADVALGGGVLVAGASGGAGGAFIFQKPQLLLDIGYTYYASDGDTGSDSFHLYDDGSFTTDTGATGRWAYQPGPQRFLLQFDPGHFCDALFLGRLQGGAVRGLYVCQDGSGERGVWVGALSLPLEALPGMPLGDASLQALEGMLRE